MKLPFYVLDLPPLLCLPSLKPSLLSQSFFFPSSTPTFLSPPLTSLFSLSPSSTPLSPPPHSLHPYTFPSPQAQFGHTVAYTLTRQAPQRTGLPECFPRALVTPAAPEARPESRDGAARMRKRVAGESGGRGRMQRVSRTGKTYKIKDSELVNSSY